MSSTKKVILIRHGVTEMNEIQDKVPWGSAHFVDVKLWDTKLSERGLAQASGLQSGLFDKHGVEIDHNMIELLVASPLKRTLQTAELAFQNRLPEHVPKMVHPLFRERVYMSSEVGKQKHHISAEHPEWDYGHIPDEENWWYEHKTDDDIQNYIEWRAPGDYAVPGEPTDIFRNRLIELRKWILSRPEECICVVTHWGVIRGLTGENFHNCEARVFDVDDLLEEPFIDDK